MSYIVPRDKPNKCTNCIYMDRITYDCKLMYGDDYPDFETQYNNCPLAEIPTPHGRLIDADALANTLRDVSKRQKYDKLFSDNVLSVGDVFDAIIADLEGTGTDGYKLIPTVIEAEGRETE